MVYNIHNPIGLKLLTRLRLGLSHLNEHRFNHNFESCLNPLCACSLEVESTTHFFIHCHHFNAISITLNNSLKAIDKDITKLSDSSAGFQELEILVHIFLCTYNNMFAYTIVHLTFRTPQIVACAHVHTSIYLAVYLPQR